MGIVAGLNIAPVSRLKHTFHDVPSQALKALESLQDTLSPTFSFKKYREALRASLAPCLPYLGTTLADVTFTEDGNPEFVCSPQAPNKNLINFAKYELISNILLEIQLYQQTAYTFAVIEPIYLFILELPTFQEDELYQLSLKLEPRNTERSQIL